MEAKVGAPYRADAGDTMLFAILVALSFTHFLNDTVQSLLPAIYPIIKTSFRLNFGQIGLITLAFQLTGAFLQPFVGFYTDRNPRPYSLPIGMAFTLCGLLLLAFAQYYVVLLCGAALIGIGSSVFHPEASRVARMASGGQHGFAQSLFQLGGNFGAATGPLIAAFIVAPHGQKSIALLALVPLIGMGVLSSVSNWYARQLASKQRRPTAMHFEGLGKRQVAVALLILLALVFSKFVYLASISSYYTFYLIQKFGVSVPHAQLLLFLFLGAAALGTLLGGPVGDRIGRRHVLFGSILGVLPFTLALPYANSLFLTALLTVIIGFILSSAFAVIIVYAQELLPGRVGTVAGLFFGFAFGMAGLGAAVLGVLADHTSITFVYHVTAYLPAIGLLTYFLPKRVAG